MASARNVFVFLLYLIFNNPNGELSQFHDQKTVKQQHKSKQPSHERGIADSAGFDSKCKYKGSLCDSVPHFSYINAYLHSVAHQHPKTTRLKVIGRSHSHRPLYVFEILPKNSVDTITVIVDFGLHAREWASQSSGLHLISRLLEKGGNETKSVRWLILPLMNPDGYHHSVTRENMWKKNRSPLNDSHCFGVDLDRNFGVGWDLNVGTDPCKDDYAGSHPFSELETKAIRRLIEKLGPYAVDVYVSVHSCEQAILYPYGHKADGISAFKLEQLKEAGAYMAKEMKKLRNRNYNVDVAYKYGGFRGGVTDFMFAHFKIPYVFKLELGDRLFSEESDFHHCYHPPSSSYMNYLKDECYVGLTALVSHVMSKKEIRHQRFYRPRMFNSFPAITNSLVLVFGIWLFNALVVGAQAPNKLTLDLLYAKVLSLSKASGLSTLIEIGRSVEDRPIYAVKIQRGVQQNSTIIMEFGIHGRELASPASGLYLLEKLLRDPACDGLLKQIKWYIIPVLNPDGYKFAVDTGKLWRKNRDRIQLSDCIGIDLNRNFPVGWENKVGSMYYCKDTYCGEKPISEPESIALKIFMDDVVQNETVKGYLAVHSCASGIFYPYGYKKQVAANFAQLEEVGQLMKEAIKKVADVDYSVAPAYALGMAGSGVDEWVFDTYKVPLVYTFELGHESRWPINECYFPSEKVTERLVKECFAGAVAMAIYLSPDALAPEQQAMCIETGTAPVILISPGNLVIIMLLDVELLAP